MIHLIVKQMPAFKRAYKKLHINEKSKVNDAIHTIVKNPDRGKEKKGDLVGVFVYKFKIHSHELLLAYEWNSQEIVLLALGFHENFYRDLKKG